MPAPKDKPEDFVKGYISEMASGQYGLAYNRLLPQHQAAVTRAMFINCSKATAPAIPEVEISIVKVYQEVDPVPGVGDLASTAVTYKVTVKGAGSFTDTGHTYNVNGAWRLSLTQAKFDAYSKGRCT